ncbi:unknown [Methanothermobacter thermautotrophicus str. Delta H]|uniref:Uncharacterized protein n=1 Tax=Methanothermobacter thermautotrophicus (strain ATCC 29096 / DSM 1053 / JCM 10044 / NBRC 100330 / Delta H) TaxID=187420 RepID=O26172_METTH|nr:unknown [Methanothermobacter thermautotrophicus str. Delta H]
MIYAFMGAYCYYHQQTEWARELGQAIISEKLDSLLDGNGTVNLEGLDDSTKKAYIGLCNLHVPFHPKPSFSIM